MGLTDILFAGAAAVVVYGISKLFGSSDGQQQERPRQNQRREPSYYNDSSWERDLRNEAAPSYTSRPTRQPSTTRNTTPDYSYYRPAKKSTKKLFHYTNSRGKNGISTSMIIRKAQKHALFGDGVYFTQLEVGHDGLTKDDIARNNYVNGSESMRKGGYVDWVVEVHIPVDEVEKCKNKRDLWLYRGQYIDLQKYQHEIKRVEEYQPGYGVYRDW